MLKPREFTILTAASLSALAALAPPVWAQIDQVYDVNDPIFEERELESIEFDINEVVWPYRSFRYSDRYISDDEVITEDELPEDSLLPSEETTMLYEGQPIPRIYRLEFEDEPFNGSDGSDELEDSTDP